MSILEKLRLFLFLWSEQCHKYLSAPRSALDFLEFSADFFTRATAVRFETTALSYIVWRSLVSGQFLHSNSAIPLSTDRYGRRLSCRKSKCILSLRHLHLFTPPPLFFLSPIHLHNYLDVCINIFAGLLIFLVQTVPSQFIRNTFARFVVQDQFGWFEHPKYSYVPVQLKARYVKVKIN